MALLTLISFSYFFIMTVPAAKSWMALLCGFKCIVKNEIHPRENFNKYRNKAWIIFIRFRVSETFLTLICLAKFPIVYPKEVQTGS